MTARSSHRSTWDRVGIYFATTGWAHLVLLAGIGIFLFPFLWMLGMSLKTTEEAATPAIFPTIPTFRPSSPTVRPPPPFDIPISVTSGQWATIQTRLKSEAVDRMTARPFAPVGSQFLDTGKLRDAAATLLVSQAVDKLPDTVWTKTPAEQSTAFDNLLTDDALRSAQTASVGMLSFHSLQVRTLDAQIRNIFDGKSIAADWTVESKNAELKPDGDDAYLHYHFDSPGSSPVVLKADFDLPADVHRIILGLTNDDSWHYFDATLDVAGQHWQTTLPNYIAEYHSGSITFQPPGFDDQTYQPRTWTPLKAAGDPTMAPGRATLRLTLHPSGTAGAIYGKVQRNYLRAFRAVPFWTYLTNSVLLVALQMVGSLFSAAFVAYAFARLNWPGRSLAFGILLSTMMLPGQVTMIPSFVIWRTLGWYNTLNPLWIGSWFGSAFFIFLMVQNMKTIPRELEEAARIDGLNALQTWWYVILPLVKPTLAAIAIMVFMAAWNDFMGPLVMLRDQSRFPLSLGLFGLKLDQTNEWTLVMAGNMLMTLPVIAIFFLFQRYFIEGVTVSGMKG